jgi:mannose/fructose/N-acetylgalactosamine-specific phosphotransferase system component IIC
MIIENIIIFAFIAALCSCDVTAFGQFMFCRPIFCAPLIGFLMGNITIGLWIGMIVEMIWTNTLPLGVAIPLDVSSIGILSTFWACKYFPGSQEAAIFGLAAAIPFAYFYKEIDIVGRTMNIKIMYWVETGVRDGKEWRINCGIIFGLFLFLARAFLFYLAAMIVGGWIYAGIYFQFPFFILDGFRKAWYMLPIFGFATVFHGYRNLKNPFKTR